MKYKVDLDHDQIEALLFSVGYTLGALWQDNLLNKKLQADLEDARRRLHEATPEDDGENVRV